MSFGDSWIASIHMRNRGKTYKRHDTIAQNIQPDVTLTKRNHKAGQTDERSPGTDVYSRGLTYQSPCKGRWSKAAMWGRPNPKFGRTWTGSQPPQPWKEGCHRLAEVDYQRSRPYLSQEPTFPHYIKSLHTPSQTHTTFIQSTRRRSSRTPLVSLE